MFLNLQYAKVTAPGDHVTVIEATLKDLHCAHTLKDLYLLLQAAALTETMVSGNGECAVPIGACKADIAVYKEYQKTL